MTEPLIDWQIHLFLIILMVIISVIIQNIRPEVTLCGWRDVQIQELINSFTLLSSEVLVIVTCTCAVWKQDWLHTYHLSRLLSCKLLVIVTRACAVWKQAWLRTHHSPRLLSCKLFVIPTWACAVWKQAWLCTHHAWWAERHRGASGAIPDSPGQGELQGQHSSCHWPEQGRQSRSLQLCVSGWFLSFLTKRQNSVCRCCLMCTDSEVLVIVTYICAPEVMCGKSVKMQLEYFIETLR